MPDFRLTMSIWELVNKAKNLTFVNAVRGATDTATLQVRKVCESQYLSICVLSV